MGKRGRPQKAGRVFYLGRLRFRPGIDPPELEDFLLSLDAAEPGERLGLLRAALVGGISGGDAVGVLEDAETTAILGDLLGDF